ncbi:MAG: GtrA family protein [Microlunatus sp.]|nr:GtrA family protein [Microlunatus sp.]
MNAILPGAEAHVQLRFVAGTAEDRTEPILHRHLDDDGLGDVRPAVGHLVGATRLDPEHPPLSQPVNRRGDLRADARSGYTVDTVSASTDATEPPAEADAVTADAALPEARPGVFSRLVRAGLTSVGATLLSHGTYISLLAAAHANATLASTIAFLIGASFNYFVGRRITWGRKQVPHPIRETLPYFTVIGASGMLSIGVATLTSHVIAPLHYTNAMRTVVLEGANIASYGVVFFFKFTLLDRLVFRHR